MPVIVRGAGNPHPVLFVCGERPGREEVQHRPPIAFVGPAGQELWARLEHIAGLSRDLCFVTNLVPTYSPHPPSPEEVEKYRDLLLADVYRIRPKYIMTVGYHAARFFLPQFAHVTGDHFHGLAFPYTYGRLVQRTATVIPIVHSSAALRQPNLYQGQLTEDIRAVHRVLRKEQGHHVVSPVTVPHVGLASFAHDSRGRIVGLDTEGTIRYPWTAECVSVSARGQDASLVELFPKSAAPHILRQRVAILQAAIDTAARVTMHHAKHDLKACHRAGLTLRANRIDDTMVMAYLLNLPQGLKELCARLLGWQMSDYADLVAPFDDARVTTALESAYESLARRCEPHAKGRRSGGRARQQDTRAVRQAAGDRPERRVGRASQAEGPKAGPPQGHGCLDVHSTLNTEAEGEGEGRRSGLGLQAADGGSEDAATAVPGRRGGRRDGELTPVPRRCLTSIKGVLTKAATATKRARWEKSKFAPWVALPPMPTWKDLPQPIREPYALLDAVGHRRLHECLWARIQDEGLEEVYALDMAVLPFLVRSEQVGMACDSRELARLSRVFQADLDRTLAQLEEIAQHPVNPNTAKQVSTFLFEELGIRPTRLNKTRTAYTTQDKYLKARRSEHEAVQLIIDARQLRKYLSTYTTKLPSLLVDGRYHPEWKYTRTATGRLAETIILLIPKHDPMAKVQQRENRAKAIRNSFHATDGHQLVSVDLSQIELRMMAHLSRDQKMLKAYARGEDLHAQTAHELLGAPKGKANQDESAHRLPAKTVNFGIINGMTEFGMLDQLHEAGQLQWDIEQVREMLTGWFEVYQGVAEYWERQKRKALKRGYVESMHGRRRYLPGITSTDERIVREAERQCLFAIQSSADEVSKVWNARIWRQVIRTQQRDGVYCEPWVRVHDDTTLEVDQRQAHAVGQDMLRLIPQLLDVPTTGEVKIGQQWGSL